MIGLHSKVKNPLLAGAITVIVVWLVKVFLHQDMPPEVASALTVLIMSITGYQSVGEAEAV